MTTDHTDHTGRGESPHDESGLCEAQAPCCDEQLCAWQICAHQWRFDYPAKDQFALLGNAESSEDRTDQYDTQKTGTTKVLISFNLAL